MSTLISGDRQFMGTNTNPLYVVALPHTFLNIASAGTNVVKSGSGTLIGIIMNKIVSLGVITIYDNTAASGTKIATIPIGRRTTDCDPAIRSYMPVVNGKHYPYTKAGKAAAKKARMKILKKKKK